ncbi:hypothetical protein EVG20_g5718 [Dentipellis fragilis]|uniref:Uncharacterized protein n=1 Tax=Dentipellis fragilis TaxID=205917 RepID=A0A4Y9YSB1_9AGAM|nr:hypothetical protein EVG20_g5718 [Dentipellis fragilis]
MVLHTQVLVIVISSDFPDNVHRLQGPWWRFGLLRLLSRFQVPASAVAAQLVAVASCVGVSLLEVFDAADTELSTRSAARSLGGYTTRTTDKDGYRRSDKIAASGILRGARLGGSRSLRSLISSSSSTLYDRIELAHDALRALPPPPGDSRFPACPFSFEPPHGSTHSNLAHDSTLLLGQYKHERGITNIERHAKV